jgi:hypothetical protein
MEKRSLTRSCTRLAVACSNLAAANPAAASDGIMTNCSCGGTCIELKCKLFVGSIVMIKATGLIAKELSGALPGGIKTVVLAEVRWSKRLGQQGPSGYAIGLKYLLN